MAPGLHLRLIRALDGNIDRCCRKLGIRIQRISLWCLEASCYLVNTWNIGIYPAKIPHRRHYNRRVGRAVLVFRLGAAKDMQALFQLFFQSIGTLAFAKGIGPQTLQASLFYGFTGTDGGVLHAAAFPKARAGS